LFDIGQETRTIDRPVEHGRCVETLEAGARRSPCASASDYRACDPAVASHGGSDRSDVTDRW
jgi:hypothetical protein